VSFVLEGEKLIFVKSGGNQYMEVEKRRRGVIKGGKGELKGEKKDVSEELHHVERLRPPLAPLHRRIRALLLAIYPARRVSLVR